MVYIFTFATLFVKEFFSQFFGASDAPFPGSPKTLEGPQR